MCWNGFSSDPSHRITRSQSCIRTADWHYRPQGYGREGFADEFEVESAQDLWRISRPRQGNHLLVCLGLAPVREREWGHVPLCAIKDALRSGSLEEGMLDPVREILNVFARIFNDHGHQVFQDLCSTPDVLPQDAAAVLRTPTGRLDMAVSVADYGSGQMTVLIGDKDPRG